MHQLQELTQERAFPGNIFKLDHGLTVIHQYIPTTPVVVADVWVRAGTSREPEQWSGMAHFLEHMIFKGSPKVAPGQFDQIIENNGAIANAATAHDYTHFFLTTAASYFSENLMLLGDILLNATIPEAEFACERDVVLAEIYSSYDDPDWLGFQALCETIYQTHPYKHSILGDETLLRQHTPHQMRCFHATHYQPENLTVVVVGGIEQESALSLVHEAFAEFKPRSECPPVVVDAEPPMIETRRCEIYVPRIDQARLTMGWLGPGVEKLNDAVGLDLISAILASGRSSRLVRELREEKKLVFDINSSFSLQKDSSLFTISAWLEPDCIDLVEKIICDRLWELQSQPLARAELLRSQRSLCNDYIFSTETPGQLAGLYGYYNTIASADLSVLYPQYIQQFTPLDVGRIASQYLSPERYAVTILQPCQ